MKPRHIFTATPRVILAAVSIQILACTQPAPPNNDAALGRPFPPAGVEAGDRIETIEDAATDVGLTDLPSDVALAEREYEDSKESATPTSKALAEAINYLLSQQSEDGGIKSRAYGVLRPGAATTALALYAIGHAPSELTQPHRESIERAYAFLKSGIDKHGKVAALDGTLDYPTYGAAMLLIAAERLELDMPGNQRDLLTQWIIDAQLTEAHDIAQDNMQYGGWDLEAASGAKGDQLQGTNISITSFALEALQGSMHKDATAAIERGRAWVARCQNDDGGFVFHVWRRHPGNKAMWTDDSQTRAISYATPTCDGMRCLMYCGAESENERIVSANDWLVMHSDARYVPGFEAQAKEYGWREGLRFYYYFTQAKALPLLPEAEAKRRATVLRKLLLAEQKPDGSFINEQPRMFEDDPLIATSLALVALGSVGEE